MPMAAGDWPLKDDCPALRWAILELLSDQRSCATICFGGAGLHYYDCPFSQFHEVKMPVTAQTGHETTVFQFQLYNIAIDEFQISRRYATQHAIDRIGAFITGTPIQVPNADIDREGFTSIGYKPNQT
jgi:hypothetical protein